MASTGQRPQQTGIVADVVVAVRPPAKRTSVYARGPLALLPTPAAAASDGRTLGMVWCMSADAAERRLALDDGAFIAELQQAFGARHGRVLRVGARRARIHWSSRPGRACVHRTVWIGNAAQTLHPVAGQDSIWHADAARLATRSLMPSHLGAIRLSSCRTMRAKTGRPRRDRRADDNCQGCSRPGQHRLPSAVRWRWQRWARSPNCDANLLGC